MVNTLTKYFTEEEVSYIKTIKRQDLVIEHIEESTEGGFAPNLEILLCSISFEATNSLHKRFENHSDFFSDIHSWNMIDSFFEELYEPSIHLLKTGLMQITFSMSDENYLFALQSNLFTVLIETLRNYFDDNTKFYINGNIEYDQAFDFTELLHQLESEEE